MVPSKNLDIQAYESHIRAFCEKWRIVKLSLFGSVLRTDFSDASDIDALASFSPEADWSLLDHIQMEQELKALFGRDVDLVSRRGLEQSRNSLRRQAILESAEPIYVAR